MAVGAESDGLIVASKSEPETFSVEATARPDGGFWRCGVHWSDTAQVVSGFDAKQLAALLAEPKLVARQVHNDPSKRAQAVPADSKELAKAKEALAAAEAKVAELEAALEEATKPAAKSGDKPSK